MQKRAIFLHVRKTSVRRDGRLGENRFKVRRDMFEGLVDGAEAIFGSSWTVSEKYRIIGGLIYEDGDIITEYTPLEDPDLFCSFARLQARGEPSESKILSWISRYGLLTLEGDRRRGYWDYPGHLEWENGAPGQATISVDAFREEVAQAHDLLTLYTEIKSRNVEAIRARAAHPRTSLDITLSSVFRSPSYNYIRGKCEEENGKGEDNADFYMAHAVLIRHASVLISDVQLHLSYSEANTLVNGSAYDEEELEPRYKFLILGNPVGDPTPALTTLWRCPSLLSAIYAQFCLMLIGNKAVKQCESPVCGLSFPAMRSNKRFCNDTCRSNARHYR